MTIHFGKFGVTNYSIGATPVMTVVLDLNPCFYFLSRFQFSFPLLFLFCVSTRKSVFLLKNVTEFAFRSIIYYLHFYITEYFLNRPIVIPRYSTDKERLRPCYAL